MSQRAPSESVPAPRPSAPWLRVAHVFIPPEQRVDPDSYRRARTLVYSCLVPVVMSVGFAWNYWHILSGWPRVTATGIVLGTNLPVDQWTAPINKDPAERPGSLTV